MSEADAGRPVTYGHGARELPGVIVDSYNLVLRDEDGFIGDRASRTAFSAIMERWREPLAQLGADPFDRKSNQASKDKLDTLLKEGHPEAGGIVHSAIEEFAQALVSVVRRFLKTPSWRDTECIVVGGGFRDSRVGELAISRAEVILKSEQGEVEIELIDHDPDEAGLIGAVHLIPSWMIGGFDAILAVDIGGTNIRAGVVELRQKKAADLSEARVWKSELWRHGDEKARRDEAVERLIGMLEDLIKAARKEGITLAPMIGVGCPGKILEDGSIEEGAQNLPGNWESSRFNLATSIHERIPAIGDHETAVLIHNDAVVQGLSALPAMKDYERWAVLTIGTGLGNARFTTRRSALPSEPDRRREKKKRRA